MNIYQKLEAILFYKNEPQKFSELAKILKVTEAEVRSGIVVLKNSLTDRGLAIIENDNEVALATNPELKEMMAEISKEEMSAEIGKAGLETLAIILYNGPISRREIEHIRGVNCSYVIRHLSIRGLIQKEGDGRGPKYSSSIELLAHLGLRDKSELPDFEKIKSEISKAAETEDEK